MVLLVSPVGHLLQPLLLLCLSHAVVFFDSLNRGKKEWIVKSLVAAPLCPKIIRHNLVPGTISAGGTSVVLKKKFLDRVSCK